MYHLVTGISLFHANQDDNLGGDSLLDLASWSDDLKARKLKVVKDRLAANLLSRLLHKDPNKRPDSMQRVLAHPFFSGNGSASLRLPGEESQYDVFISYRVAADAEHTERLYNLLTKRGLKVWWDRVCLKPGVPWEQ